jgi:hypothetical protein
MLDDDEIDALEGRPPRNREEDGPTPLDPLVRYGIEASMPLRLKVELLVLSNLSSGAIAELLHRRAEDIALIVDEIEVGWGRSGKALTAEDRDRARGKALAELEMLRQNIDKQLARNPSERLMALKVQLLDRLIELQGLKLGKNEAGAEEQNIDAFDKAVGLLSATQLSDLHSRLSNVSS